MQVDLRTDYEWKEDASSQVVSEATVWKAKHVGGNMYEVILVTYSEPATQCCC